MTAKDQFDSFASTVDAPALRPLSRTAALTRPGCNGAWAQCGLTDRGRSGLSASAVELHEADVRRLQIPSDETRDLQVLAIARPHQGVTSAFPV